MLTFVIYRMRFILNYISIDGDDIGRKITSCYLSNNRQELINISQSLYEFTKKIATELQNYGFDIIFCAADGVVASTELDISLEAVYHEIQILAPNNMTFSAGIGTSLSEAYIALMSAKSNGKNCLHNYAKLGL